MGEPPIFCQSWENEELARFILRIDCSMAEKPDDTGNETGKLVRHMLGLRTQEQMSRFLWCLLTLVFERSFNVDGVLRDNENLSKSLEDLEIKFEEIIGLYNSPERNAVNKNGFKVIQEKISKMKLIRPGLNVEKKVIPVIVFDEADILRKNTFKFVIPAGNTAEDPIKWDWESIIAAAVVVMMVIFIFLVLWGVKALWAVVWIYLVDALDSVLRKAWPNWKSELENALQIWHSSDQDDKNFFEKCKTVYGLLQDALRNLYPAFKNIYGKCKAVYRERKIEQESLQDFDTSRLIARVLIDYSSELDQCPVIFEKEKSMNAGLGPSPLEEPDRGKLSDTNAIAQHV